MLMFSNLARNASLRIIKQQLFGNGRLTAVYLPQNCRALATAEKATAVKIKKVKTEKVTSGISTTVLRIRVSRLLVLLHLSFIAFASIDLRPSLYAQGLFSIIKKISLEIHLLQFVRTSIVCHYLRQE